MNRLFLLVAATFGLLVGTTASSQGQVLVYKLDFTKVKGVNFVTFEGGYVVTPLLGGASSFLLTSMESRRTFITSEAGGNFFTAVTPGDDRKAVLSATTGVGTAAGAMVLIGDVDHVVKVNNRVQSLAAKVAKSLNGTMVSADDESTVDTAAVDGSIGSAGIANVKMSLDETETNIANKDGLTMAQTVEQLKLELERQGFTADDGTDGTTDPAAPVTGTPTVTTSSTPK